MSVLRGSNFNAEVASGRLRTELDELTGELSVIPVMESSYLKRGDIYRSITGGGGGFGDPLWRDAEQVVADITSGAVSPAEAEATYGVIRGAHGDADPAATAERRAQLLRERLDQAIAPTGEGSSCDPANAERVLTGGFALYRVADALHIGCSCGRVFAPTVRNYKEGLAVLEGPLQTAGPLVDPYGLGDAFVYRRFLCPGCGRTMENEVTPRSESALEDIHIGAGGSA
jgi:N-methylhydantoinase B